MFQADTQHIIPVAISVATIYGISRLIKIGARDPHLPPGPPTVPLLGNLHILPLKDSYLKFTEWAKQYGNVYSLKVGPQTMVVVSSLESIYEIFEKDGAKSADRPDIPTFRRFAGESALVGGARYGTVWRKLRRACVEVMKPAAREKQKPIQMAEISQLLFDTQENPDNLFYHLQRYAVSTVFSIVCGTRIPQVNSPLSVNFFRFLDLANKVSQPGTAPPVDLLPILNYVPDRFANNWKAQCDTIKKLLDEIMFDIVEGASKRLSQGQPNGSDLEIVMENAAEWGLTKEDIVSLASGLLVGGAASTASLLQWVVLLSTAFPEAQRKVQEELDRVIGSDRQPTVEDIPSLPYLNAFVKEMSRFRPLTPTAMPHRALEDIVYEGHVIPKDSTLFMNVWSVYRSTDLFDNPEEFEPERFLRSAYGTKAGAEERVNDEALKKLDSLYFGAGRRKCPGQPIALETQALVAANLLWAFSFSPLVNEDGSIIQPDPWAFTSGLSHDPLPFKFNVKPRTDQHADYIRHAYVQATPVLELFEQDLGEEDKKYVEEIRSKLT